MAKEYGIINLSYFPSLMHEDSPETRRVKKEVFRNDEKAYNADPNLAEAQKDSYRIEMPNGDINWKRIANDIRGFFVNIFRLQFLKNLRKDKNTKEKL